MNRKIKSTILIIFLALALILSACQGASPPAQEPTPIPTVVGEAGVTVEGKLAPVESVNLSFNMGGTIVDVSVTEGERVEAGQTIAQLDQRERLDAAVASAELELVGARQALETLDDNAEVAAADAQKRVADARDAVRHAEWYLNNLEDGSRPTDIDEAKANVVLLKDRLEQAQEDFSSYENKPEDNVTRAQLLSKLAAAQQSYDDAVRLLNNLEGNASEIDMSIGQANLALAEANLTLAEREYEKVKDGPDPDDLEVAQARLKAAESGLAAARQSLTNAELVAPFSGTVVQLDLKVGEQAIPGNPAVILADLSGWVVETDDLNEMEIPRVEEGQFVSVTPDALPDLTLRGVVESISQFSVERFGDVTYTAKIDLEESDPRLRWGMTVKVLFEG